MFNRRNGAWAAAARAYRDNVKLMARQMPASQPANAANADGDKWNGSRNANGAP
jgi:hypothetical protein